MRNSVEELPTVDEVLAGVAGALLLLHLPPKADELIHAVMAGEDTSGLESFERPPE